MACIPAALYSVQNFAKLLAYQNLQPLTLNVLNQTKTIWAALCCYLIIGKVQSKLQIVALSLLFVSACVIEKIITFNVSLLGRSIDKGDRNVIYDGVMRSGGQGKLNCKNNGTGNNHSLGVVSILLASFISGLAGAISQRNLQRGIPDLVLSGRNSFLFTMELCAATLVFVLCSTLKSNDGERIKINGFFDGWTPLMLLPICTNAVGGILVGLVTKYSGAVKKGFSLIFGLLLSGILQAKMTDEGNKTGNVTSVTKEQIFGGMLAAFSLFLYSVK